MIYLWQVEIFSCHVRLLERFTGLNHQPVMLPLRLQRRRPWLISSLALQDVSRRLIEIPQTDVGISQYEKDIKGHKLRCSLYFDLFQVPKQNFGLKTGYWIKTWANKEHLFDCYILLTCHVGHIPCCHVERHSLQVCLLGSDTARWQT